MNKEPTKAQILSQYDFTRISQIAGKFNVNAKNVQQFKKNINEMNLEVEKVHMIIDALKKEDLI